MEYCIDVYVKKKKWWMKKYNFKEVNGKYGIYFTIKVNKNDKKKIIRKLNWGHIRYRCYESRWTRSSNYREKFLKENKGPYKCRYCNKPIKKDGMVVDHIISIYQAKSNKKARTLLNARGITDVNDLRNLVASCRKCNEAKSEKMGIWIIKAYLGKYKWYWTVRKLLYICLFSLVLWSLYNALPELIYFLKAI